MANPVLESIHPVNLLSFGAGTEPVTLKSLNILIGPNGSGKSNFIEAIRLLNVLPDKDPWSSVLATGGVSEWIYKEKRSKRMDCSLGAQLSLSQETKSGLDLKAKRFGYSIDLQKNDSSFRVKGEQVVIAGSTADLIKLQRSGSQGSTDLRHGPASFSLNPDRSILSQLASPSIQSSRIGVDLPELFEIAQFFESFDFHQDWDFGVDCPPREPQPVGQPVSRLDERGANLAQMLAHYRDDEKPTFERLTDMVRRFYEAVKTVEVRLISTHLQIAVEETGGFSTPAIRLSDGMLRWLAILCILLNPSPPPVTCIDEPELGLHPDIMPTLADLLREASTRTQLIVTTHSSVLVDAFSHDAGSICVCEKIEGSTVIERLSEDDLSVWLKNYSLGSLWISGQIGGDRW